MRIENAWTGGGDILPGIPGSLNPVEIVEMIRTPYKYIHDRFDKHGHVFRSRIIYPIVWMVGVDCNRFMMVTRRHDFSYEKGYGKLAFAKLFPKSILLLDGDEAGHARGILTPALGRLGIRDSCEKVTEIWKRRTETLDDGRSRDAYDFVLRSTFDVSANALTGVQLGDELESYRPLFEELIVGAMANTQIRVPMGKLDRGLRARNEIVRRMTPTVEEARRNEPEGMVGLLAHYKDDAGNYLPIEEVVNHLLLLFWAGYDTTASAGSWVVHLLAHHPAWQEELKEEADRVIGDRDFELGDVAELEKLSWFIREQERFAPSIFMFPRVTNEDIEYKGFHIPKDTAVMWTPYMTHRDPAAFEHPNIFDPGRWSDERGDRKAKSKNLFGFGGGPRLCLGRNFALMQLRVMITTLVRNYVIEPDPTAQWSPQALPMHHPVNSRVHFRRRH